MGAFTSRNNAAVEEADQLSNQAYKYPPKTGNFFGSHFIMGGERFDSPQPESYLFGENADLNFLGTRPTAFPYPPPQANEPTKTLKSLVNVRKESVRFVRVPQEKKIESFTVITAEEEQIDGNILCTADGGGEADTQNTCAYNIEFIFDSDVKCAITIFYFCTEEESPSGVKLIPRDGLTSETYHFEKGVNQYFSQPGHIFKPQLIPEDDLMYNPTKEQYPVAIYCVVEEGNEECRQSHTTICVIDHHPETNSYILRALKQKIFVDGLCYLLQEIYGIENKAVNKSSIDEDLDDHGSECVICMSETRDTLILPCRHLCLCNSCADSLRYQANNCPICRAPFRALLQIRAVQKGFASHLILHQNTPTGTGEPAPCDQHIPPGYIPVSLIEALNGPTQYISSRPRITEIDISNGIQTTILGDNYKNTSPPLKTSSQRRSKTKKNVSTSTSTHEVGTITNPVSITKTEVPVETVNSGTNTVSTQISSPTLEKSDKLLSSRISQDKLQFVNERHSLKLPKSKRSTNGNSNMNHSNDAADDDDSENEKLSPLLSPGSKSKPLSNQLVKKLTIEDSAEEDNNTGENAEIKNNTFKKHARPELAPTQVTNNAAADNIEPTTINAEDSDYYTPEDTQNSILSPLCPERTAKSTDKLSSLKGNAGSFKNANNLVKKNLHKKSTSVGNIVGPANVTSELKTNVSSLPDMLDSPISGNSASTRSSSDSYSSSSSTKQLLSSNPTTTAANIIVDDKTALQNAVNV